MIIKTELLCLLFMTNTCYTGLGDCDDLVVKLCIYFLSFQLNNIIKREYNLK